MAGKGQFVGLDSKDITRLHNQEMTGKRIFITFQTLVLLYYTNYTPREAFPSIRPTIAVLILLSVLQLTEQCVRSYIVLGGQRSIASTLVDCPVCSINNFSPTLILGAILRGSVTCTVWFDMCQ